MQVRPLDEPDREAVLDLWGALMANGAERDPRWVPAPDGRETMSRWSMRWAQQVPFPHGWVAEDEGELVAFLAGFPMSPLPVLLRPHSARISDMYVRPSHRRRGLGRRLVEAFRAAATAAGYPELVVSTLVMDEDAIAFWQAMDFAPEHVVFRKLGDTPS